MGILKKYIMIKIDESEKMQLAEKIHKQLVGNPDYVENNIVLNCNSEDTIELYFFKGCKEISQITI